MFIDLRLETRNLAQPGQAHNVVSENLISDIDIAIKGKRCLNIRDIAKKLNASIGTVLSIIHDRPTSIFAEGIPKRPKQWG